MDKSASISALALSGAAIDKNNKAIARTGKAFDKLVHVTGVAIIIASMPQSEGGHLDASKALDYVKALSDGASRGRVVAWLQEFSNIRVNVTKQEDNSFKWSMKLLKMGDDGYRKARPLDAQDKPFWSFQEDRNLAPFVFGEDYLARSLTTILSRYDKAKEAGNVDPNMPAADIAVLDQLRKLQQAVVARAEGLARQRAASTAKPKANPNPAKAKAQRALAKDNAKDAAKMAGAGAAA